uniref:Ankyrin repeat family A protein 2-like n=1 Tax=Saccoglossus kowalevskii TaxID=10224 RepID=A0ABM0LY51_SACKO|nr:PREDICTED: ankyrin repeat family A protein 2-like [Saccoglossus kowalevskii]
MAMCSTLLKSLNEDGYHGDIEGDSASPDWEVASVLFPDGRLKSPTPSLKRVCSSTSSSSKSSYSPLKQPTTFTNKQRGNKQTITPCLFQELTPHELAAQGELTFLSDRILAGVNVNIQDENGHTPLMWACAQNQTSVVEFLLEKGADASIESVEKETALAFACSQGNVEIVKLLLQSGVDVNSYDMNGGTPLLYAVYNNHPKCVHFLLRSGADLTDETETGCSPLNVAMLLGHQTGKLVIFNSCYTFMYRGSCYYPAAHGFAGTEA